MLNVATDWDSVAVDYDCRRFLLELTGDLPTVIDGLLTPTETEFRNPRWPTTAAVLEAKDLRVLGRV